MTRKSKKMRRRSISPRRRSLTGMSKNKPLSIKQLGPKMITNAAPEDLASLMFIGKISRSS